MIFLAILNVTDIVFPLSHEIAKQLSFKKGTFTCCLDCLGAAKKLYIMNSLYSCDSKVIKNKQTKIKNIEQSFMAMLILRMFTTQQPLEHYT